MKKNSYKGKTAFNALFTFVAFMLILASCEEKGRYNPKIDDSTPPGQIEQVSYKPLYGGARFSYKVPADEDLLMVEAIHTNDKGESFSFTSSYFADSLDVYGFPDTMTYDVKLYAVDRAGNKSQPVTVTVKPLESVVSRVNKSLVVKPGFASFFINWQNELEQSINLFVDFHFTKDGKKSEFTSVFSSNLPDERRFINDLDLSADDEITVNVRVEDLYGNSQTADSTWLLSVLQDQLIPKDNWQLPLANDTVANVPQCYGDGLEGRSRYVIDDIIDMGDNLNFMHTNGVGRTGKEDDGNMPWNFIIDLGDYYELSRIVTHQRHSHGAYDGVSRGQYYNHENVNLYAMYYLDESTNEWVTISIHYIPTPLGLTDLEYMKLGQAGDWAYMYPDNPGYTKATRWFRYEALGGFVNGKTNCLSEITLYGKKKTP